MINAAFVFSCIALVVSIATAGAAWKSAHNSGRSATAAEQQVALATPPNVRFEVRRSGETEFALINLGTSRVTSVTLVVDREPSLTRDWPAGATLEKDEAWPFRMFKTRHSPIPATMSVTCAESEHPLFAPVVQQG